LTIVRREIPQAGKNRGATIRAAIVPTESRFSPAYDRGSRGRGVNLRKERVLLITSAAYHPLTKDSGRATANSTRLSIKFIVTTWNRLLPRLRMVATSDACCCTAMFEVSPMKSKPSRAIGAPTA